MSETPEVEVSPATKLAAKTGLAKYNERYADGYIDLELKSIKEADRDHSRFLARRSNAGVMQKTGGFDPTKKGFTQHAIGTAAGAMASDVNAVKNATEVQDKKRLMTVQTGQGKLTNASNILSDTSNMATQRAINDAQNQVLVDNSVAQAAFGVAKSGIANIATQDDFKAWQADIAKQNKDLPADAQLSDSRFDWLGGGSL